VAVTDSPAAVAMILNPSHFTSAAQPSPAGVLPLLANIGARRVGVTG
jgi:hypothetical protein